MILSGLNISRKTILFVLLSFCVTESSNLSANEIENVNESSGANTNAVSNAAENARIFDQSLKVESLYEGLNKPWGVAQVEQDVFIITERNGSLRLWDHKQKVMSEANEQFVEQVFQSGQGGMLDVIAHPEFEKNHWVYFTYVSGHSFSNATTLVRAKLNTQASIQTETKTNKPAFLLSDIKILFRASPMKAASYHFGGRMAFLPDNTLVFGVGDGYNYMDDAQKLTSHLGKIIRLHDTGSVPDDNPFVEQAKSNKDIKPEIYTWGHRNPQGLFYDKKRGVLLSNEHGPKGGDEINIIKPGLNYGWPKITFGIDYSGLEITPDQTKKGLESPLVNWTPSIAPSSMLIYEGKEFPEFNEKLLNTALKYQEVRVVELAEFSDANKSPKTQASPGATLSHGNWALKGQKTLLKEMKERLRDITSDNQGRLLLITDTGKLLQVSKSE